MIHVISANYFFSALQSRPNVANTYFFPYNCAMQAKKYVVFFHKTQKKNFQHAHWNIISWTFSCVVNTWPQPFEAEKDSVLLGFQFDWGGGVGFGSNNRKVRDIVKFYYAFTSRPTNVASTFLNSFSKTSPWRQERSPRNCLVPRRLSLSRWKCARKGRPEGDNGRSLPMVPCGSSGTRLITSQKHFCMGWFSGETACFRPAVFKISSLPLTASYPFSSPF